MDEAGIIQLLSQGGMIAVGGVLVGWLIFKVWPAQERKLEAQQKLHREERTETRTMFAAQLEAVTAGLGTRVDTVEEKVDAMADDVEDIKEGVGRIEDAIREPHGEAHP